MNWNDLKIIFALAKAGTLSGAARELGVSHSTILRQINTIENRMDTRFFERLPTGYALTDAGEAALKVARGMDEEVQRLIGELKGKDLRLQGDIRLTAPEGISHYLLGPHLASFSRLHPDIHIELEVTGTSLAMDRREADLAVRVTPNPPENCIGHKICVFNYAIYAAPAYLERVPDRPFSEYEYIVHFLALNLPLPSIWKKPAQPKYLMKTNSLLTLVNAVKQGMGAAILPYLVGDQEPGLQRVSPPILDYTSQLWVLTHGDLRKTARVKALMGHLVQGLSKDKHWVEGVSG